MGPACQVLTGELTERGCVECVISSNAEGLPEDLRHPGTLVDAVTGERTATRCVVRLASENVSETNER